MRALAEVLAALTVSGIAAVFTGRWLRILSLRYAQARDDRRYGRLGSVHRRRRKAPVIRLEDRRQ